MSTCSPTGDTAKLGYKHNAALMPFLAIIVSPSTVQWNPEAISYKSLVIIENSLTHFGPGLAI